MKTLVSLFFAAFVLTGVSSYAQEQKSVFENAGLATASDGLPCVQLNWKKGSENTDYYLVERSADGKAFRQIALVFTAEDEKIVDYKFRDKEYGALGNASYYRITLVNSRKELTHLPVRKVVLSGTSVITTDHLRALVSRN